MVQSPKFYINTEIYPPVVESQRFLFIRWRHFILKEEDLDQNYLENHQGDHQTDGQTETHKTELEINQSFVCLHTAATARKAVLHHNSQVGEHVQCFPMQYRKNQQVGQQQGKQEMDKMDNHVS